MYCVAYVLYRLTVTNMNGVGGKPGRAWIFSMFYKTSRQSSTAVLAAVL